MIHENSLEAYEKVKPNLTNKQNAVINALKELNHACIKEVAEMLNVLPNEISGRFTELKRMGKIVFSEKIKYKGSTHSRYKLNLEL